MRGMNRFAGRQEIPTAGNGYAPPQDTSVRSSGDVTTPPTPGTPRGSLVTLLSVASLPSDSLLTDARVAELLTLDADSAKAKFNAWYCTPPGPFYCEQERLDWAHQNPWCSESAVPLVTVPTFTDDVTRNAWIATHPTCTPPPPVLTSHVCTPGDPSCSTGPNPSKWVVPALVGLAVGWGLMKMFEGDSRENPRDTTGLVYLKREPLNRGGYTSRGQYFGIGAPLYRWSVDFTNGDYDGGHVRGATREAAMAKVREKHPGAKFVNG